MSTEPDCLFCSIAAGSIPADVVSADDTFVAFRDIDPQAPVHILVIPRQHFPNAAALANADLTLTGRLFTVAAAQVAEAAGLTGYRIVLNTGPTAARPLIMCMPTCSVGARCPGHRGEWRSGRDGRYRRRWTGSTGRCDERERRRAHRGSRLPTDAGCAGVSDAPLRVVENSFPDLDIHVRGNDISLSGPGARSPPGRTVVRGVAGHAAYRAGTDPGHRGAVHRMLRAGDASPSNVLTANILSNRGKTIRPKTLNQKHYVDAIDRNTVTFGIGPAGTGRPIWRWPKRYRHSSAGHQSHHPDPSRGGGR